MDTTTSNEQMAGTLPHIYRFPQYLFRRRMLKLIGGQVDISTTDGRPVFCCLQKAFKLKEDISLFTDESKTTELINIKARQIIDFSAAYDVKDVQTGEMIGTLRRKGWSSMIRDAWEVLDARGQVIATINEDSLVLALVRRLLTNLIPQSFHFQTPTGEILAQAHQNFNPFIHKMDLIMPQGPHAAIIDPRLTLAATALLVLIEGRQQ